MVETLTYFLLEDQNATDLLINSGFISIDQRDV